MASYEKLTSGQREPGQQNISCFGWKYKVQNKVSFFIFILFSFDKLSIKLSLFAHSLNDYQF